MWRSGYFVYFDGKVILESCEKALVFAQESRTAGTDRHVVYLVSKRRCNASCLGLIRAHCTVAWKTILAMASTDGHCDRDTH